MSSYSGPRYLTTREVSARIRLSTGHLANERSQKRGIPYYKFGSACLYLVEDIETWEAASRVEVSS
jgi:hypothetical protein